MQTITPVSRLNLVSACLQNAKKSEPKHWIGQAKFWLRGFDEINPNDYSTIEELENIVNFLKEAHSQPQPAPNWIRPLEVLNGTAEALFSGIGNIVRQFCPRPNPEEYEVDVNGEQEVERPEIVPEVAPKASLIEVDLVDARQYDMEGNIPAACTFHAIQAIETIYSDSNFDLYRELLDERSHSLLSEFQQDILLEGLQKYNKAVRSNQKFQEGADIEQIPRDLFPVAIGEKQVVVVTDETLVKSIQTLTDQLFQPGHYAVILKNSNDETSALIRKKNEVIFFDSHKNSMVLARGKKAVTEQLEDNLRPFIGAMNTFEYALITQ